MNKRLSTLGGVSLSTFSIVPCVSRQTCSLAMGLPHTVDRLFCPWFYFCSTHCLDLGEWGDHRWFIRLPPFWSFFPAGVVFLRCFVNFTLYQKNRISFCVTGACSLPQFARLFPFICQTFLFFHLKLHLTLKELTSYRTLALNGGLISILPCKRECEFLENSSTDQQFGDEDSLGYLKKNHCYWFGCWFFIVRAVRSAESNINNKSLPVHCGDWSWYSNIFNEWKEK